MKAAGDERRLAQNLPQKIGREAPQRGPCRRKDAGEDSVNGPHLQG